MEDKKMTRHGQKMHSCDEIFGKLHVIHARWYRRQASPCRFLLFLFFFFFFFFFFLVAHKFCLGYMSRLRRLLSSPHVHFEVSFRAGSVRQSLWIKRPWPALTFTIVVNYSKLLFFLSHTPLTLAGVGAPNARRLPPWPQRELCHLYFHLWLEVYIRIHRSVRLWAEFQS